MVKHYINNYNDIIEFLDSQTASVEWDDFYGQRKYPAPFIIQNELPDENLVEFLNVNTKIKSAIELGCGEGRNAIYIAKQGIRTVGLDISQTAITNAVKNAENNNVNIDFYCFDIFNTTIKDKYDYVYDSGLFHHLSPHRRITYLEILKSIINPGGYFGLTCFAWGKNCADEVDDWEFYKEPFRAGVAFTKERLIELFQPHFDIVEIRMYKQGISNTIQGLDFMWTCLFKDKRTM